MKDFADTSNTTGIFPNVACQNISAPGDGLGTPAVYEWVQNLWGWPQALLDHVGETPDTNVETGASSQLLTAMTLLGGVYPGCVIPLHINVDPATLSPTPRLLLLTGQLIVAADYLELVAATWIGSSDNATATAYYRTNFDDTVRADAGTHMRLPDARGYAMRGLDTPAAVDPDGASRIMADVQTDGVANHAHVVTLPLALDAGQNWQMAFNTPAIPDGFTILNLTQTGVTWSSAAILATGAVGGGNWPGAQTPTDIYKYGTTKTYAGADYGETRMVNMSASWAVVY